MAPRKSLTTTRSIKTQWLKIGYEVVKNCLFRVFIDNAFAPDAKLKKYKVASAEPLDDLLALLLVPTQASKFFIKLFPKLSVNFGHQWR